MVSAASPPRQCNSQSAADRVSARAPVIASAFHPALAPVGVLLAVLGYALGTYGAWLSGQLLRMLVGA